MRVPAAVALLVLGACSPEARPVVPPESPLPAPATEGEWELRAQFPGATKANVSPVNTPAGVLEQHTESFQDEHGGFFAQWADYPQAYVSSVSRDALYENAGLGAAAAVGGKITNTRPLELSGFAGREVLVDDGRGAAYQARFFLVGRRLLLAGVATAPARLSEPRVRDFFASVRLMRAR